MEPYAYRHITPHVIMWCRLPCRTRFTYFPVEPTLNDTEFPHRIKFYVFRLFPTFLIRSGVLVASEMLLYTFEKSEHCQRFVFAKLTRLYTMRIGGCASHFSFAFGRCNRRTRLKGTWFAKNVRSAVKLLSLSFFAHAGQSPFNGKPSHETTGFCKIWG